MQAIWFKDCKTSEERETRKKEVYSYRRAFEALTKILDKPDRPKVDYTIPSWSHQQAHYNGETASLDRVLKLITLKD